MRARLIALLLGVLPMAGGAVQARVSREPRDEAQEKVDRDLTKVPLPDRAGVAFARCRDAFDARDAAQAPVWCSAASNWASWSPDPVLKVETTSAAYIATGGFVQYLDPARLVDLPGDPSLSLVRAKVFALALVNASRGRARIPLSAYSHLAALLGMQPLKSKSLPDQRLELLAALERRSPDSAGSWAAAAVAATYRYGVSGTATEKRAGYRALASALSPFLEAAKDLDGWDAALFPELTINWAEMESAVDAGGRESAASARKQGLRKCESKLWPDHYLCFQLRYQIAYGAVTETILERHPERDGGVGDEALRPPRLTGSFLSYESESFRTSCRVIERFDIDDSGTVIDINTVYSDPPGECDGKAKETVSAFRYAPKSPDRPGEIRTDLIEGYARTPPW